MIEVGAANDPSTIRPGTYAVASVRQPGSSIYRRIGLQDFTTDDVYSERGINLLHAQTRSPRVGRPARQVRQPSAFQRDILPLIQAVPLSRLQRATGLSIRYVSLIRRGERTPHPRHWSGFVRASRGSNPP
jgi:hypothetical protein